MSPHDRQLAVLTAVMLVLTALGTGVAGATTGESGTSVAVETVGASDVGEESATFDGNLTRLDGADDATVYFTYWEEANPNETVSTTATLTVDSTGEYSIDAEGLEPNTTYVVVARADAGNASAVGDPVSFTTAEHESVAVETSEATDVTEDTATLEGELTDLQGVSNATVSFSYWEEGRENETRNTTGRVTRETPGTVSASVTGLAENTTYVYRAEAVSGNGNVSDVGTNETFATDEVAPLGVDTEPATDVGTTTATVNGELTGLGDGDTATVYFEYWVEGDRANSSVTSADALVSTGEVAREVDGLEPDTTYRYVAYAATDDAAVDGDQVTFTTDRRTVDDGDLSVGVGRGGGYLVFAVTDGGEGVADAEVTVTDEDGGSDTFTTDDDGYVVLSGPDERTTVTVEADAGSATGTRTTTVPPTRGKAPHVPPGAYVSAYADSVHGDDDVSGPPGRFIAHAAIGHAPSPGPPVLDDADEDDENDVDDDRADDDGHPGEGRGHGKDNPGKGNGNEHPGNGNGPPH